MVGLGEKDLERIFTSHLLDAQQTEAVAEVRRAAKLLAQTILRLVPPSPEQTIAIRSTQEAMMFANAAISGLGGKPG